VAMGGRGTVRALALAVALALALARGGLGVRAVGGRGGRCGGLARCGPRRAALAATEAIAADRGRGEQRAAFLERQRLRIAFLRNPGVLDLVRDVRSITPVQHLDVVDAEVL